MGLLRLFYSFNLDQHVPADHLLRGIDRFLDLADLRRHLALFYSHTGRPSIDPELMVRMLLVGYCFGIRSERRLCEEVHLNLAYRWFCRLGLEDVVPDHSSFSKNRHGRFRDSDVFRQLFESVVERCIAEGLVGGEGFAIDASIIRADANRRRGVSSTQLIEWPSPEQRSRAVREYLAALDEAEPVGSPPKHVSMTDPAARWTAAPGCPAYYAYSTNYLVDVESGVIVDVEATAAHRTEETEATKTMIERVEERHDIKPQRLIGDTAYGTGPMLEWLARTRASNRTYPSGRRANAPTAPSRSATSDGTTTRTSTAARRVNHFAVNGDRSVSSAVTLPKPTRSFIVRASRPAPLAR